MKKVFLLTLSIILVISLTACGGAGNTGGGASSGEFRVALLLPGAITDRGWSASGHAGLMAVEREFGLDVAFKESVQQSDMESDFRFFASTGYNILVGMGSQFTDALLAVAEEFPEHKFVLVNGSVYGDNVRSVQLSDEQAGYVAGALATLMTETGKVGMVAGQDVPPIIRGLNGFEQAVRETSQRIGKDVEYITTMTGSMDDVARAKEFALSLIDQNVDVIYELANQAGLGVIEAVVERDKLIIGSSTDQSEAAPDHVLQSMVRDTPAAYVHFVRQIIEGNFVPEVVVFGVGEGVIHLAPWHNFEERVPQSVKDELAAIMRDMSDGTIIVTGQ
jgi:basic membrane protein A